MDDAGVERKRAGELSYWSKLKDSEGRVSRTGGFHNGWFERFYTSLFGLTAADYAGKRVLDVGCGPRGSLEWATMARERVGVDPLAGEYLRMGAADHAMTYVEARAESIPYPDGHFDIVCSFNSLDHVDDLDDTVAEIKRVTAVGGLMLLITDVHGEPTPQEPVCFDWDVVGLFAPELVPQFVGCYEKQGQVYASFEQNVLFDHANSRRRYGVLAARFMRVAAGKRRMNLLSRFWPGSSA